METCNLDRHPSSESSFDASSPTQPLGTCRVAPRRHHRQSPESLGPCSLLLMVGMAITITWTLGQLLPYLTTMIPRHCLPRQSTVFVHAAIMLPVVPVDLATTTTQTPRLTQPYQMMTMTSLPSPVNRPYLCSHQASSCSLLPFTGHFASALEMMFPGDVVSRFASALPVSPGVPELDALFEHHGVSWPAIDEMFALDWATYRRCFSEQPPLSFWQRYKRRRCARQQHGSKSSNVAFLSGNNNFNCRNARSFDWYPPSLLAHGAQVVAEV